MTYAQERHAADMRHKNMLEPPSRPAMDQLPPRIRTVLRISAADHGVTPADILSGLRHKPISAARRQAIQTLKRMELSFPEIGRYLGLHHTTCIYAMRNQAKVGKYAGVKATWGQPVNYPDLSGEWAI